MKRWIPLLLLSFAPLGARADLGREIRGARLDTYEAAGQHVSGFLRRTLTKLADSVDEGQLAEKFDAAYQDRIRPGALENLSFESRPNRITIFIEDVHRALDLRQRHAIEFRRNPSVRRRIQNIFIGALHVLDVEIRTELDSSIDELLRIRRFLLSQGTFVTRGTSRLTVDDVWWDWLWLRGNGYPSDLTEWHLQKIQAISRQSGMAWRERLRKHALSVAVYTLRHNTQPVLGREKASVISLRLTNSAIDLAEGGAALPLVKELKLYLYRGLQANGQTYEASQIKKEIAMDLFIAKGWQIVKSPAAPWQRRDIGFFSKVISSFSQLVHSVFSFITYGAGFLFVATPIEVLLVILAIVILCRQGETHFKEQLPRIRALAITHRLAAKDGWRRVPAFVKESALTLWLGIKLAWRMFVASYTMAAVPFYSKVASSLLLFGIGLYFNSARSLVEAVVAQMTTL